MIETADDIIAAMRSIIADYEEHHYVHKVYKPELSGTPEPDKAAVAKPAPRTPAAAATSISIEDSARRAAMHGRQYFLDWYGKRSDADRKQVQAIAGEIKELYPK